MNASTLRALVLAAAVCTFASAFSVQAANNGMSNADYVARLHPLNTGVTELETTGEARFLMTDGKLLIRIKARKVASDIMHLQHFHGFKDGRAARCATQAADANGDGIVDLIETEQVSGTTMVPFTADPASMKIVTETYPKASSKGRYDYRDFVSLKHLKKAFADAFDGQNLDLGSRVVYVHGVPADTNLPESVASLGDIPAHVTLPIACGEIQAAGN